MRLLPLLQVEEGGTQRQFTTQEACAEVWALVADHLLAIAESPRLAKFQGFIDAAVALFPPPPAMVAASEAAWPGLEAAEAPPVGAPGIVNPFGRAQALEALQGDPYLSIYKSLYYLKACLQPEVRGGAGGQALAGR